MVSKDQQPRQVKLNNGLDMPLLGLGVYNMYGEEAENTVLRAFEIGYRLIDTAAMYRNEKDIGNAVIRSGLARTEIFITSKVDNADQGYDATLRAYEKTLANLQTTYLDLYLVHWPIKHKRKETWRAFEKIYGGGAVKAIGVANYLEPFLRELAEYSQIIPAVNQVEFSPYLYSDELLQYCRKNRIQMQAYSPLVRGKKMDDPKLLYLAKKYQKTPAQIMLRWDIELGVAPIPKSAKPDRLKENIDIFDFHLAAEDIDWMKSFHDNSRVAENPMNHF